MDHHAPTISLDDLQSLATTALGRPVALVAEPRNGRGERLTLTTASVRIVMHSRRYKDPDLVRRKLRGLLESIVRAQSADPASRFNAENVAELRARLDHLDRLSRDIDEIVSALEGAEQPLSC
jgi:hypothetical protein